MWVEWNYKPTTFVYGKKSREERRQLWTTIPLLANPTSILLWIVLGDFNEIRSPEERVESGIYSHRGPAEFIESKNKAPRFPMWVCDYTIGISA